MSEENVIVQPSDHTAPQPSDHTTPAPERALYDWQSRVVDEKNALDDKLSKLYLYVTGVQFLALEPVDRERLTRQRLYMTCYSNVLLERVQAFNHDGALRALEFPSPWVIRD